MSAEKAKYRVLRLSHIHNNLWPEGSEIEYDGMPGSALEPLNEAAKEAKAKATQKVVAPAVVKPEPLNEAAKEAKAKATQKVVAPAVVKPEPLNEGGGGDDELDKLREEYELLFNEKPHHNTKAETLREKIAEKRKDLGV
ncbi:hypothetical protein KQ279_14395 [Klebsiella pneumoniae]|uniref:hypothetical protein n=1 Tax=Klebsiella pneumoniae TaxID=573 RepID=UPI00217E402F|nr:hypothetical protein [Klebsiella pneumoniae]MCS6352570.1 hypothetical protein [Klebsiella pneumoniae]MCW8016452.1 hypothetical protein [Klebsiella pneumoniae]HEN5152319.1 hypothetical protein [Klebsiella pneumoniae]